MATTEQPSPTLQMHSLNTPLHQSCFSQASSYTLFSSSPDREGGSVAVVVWFEGPFEGQTQILGLLVCQLG